MQLWPLPRAHREKSPGGMRGSGQEVERTEPAWRQAEAYGASELCGRQAAVHQHGLGPLDLHAPGGAACGRLRPTWKGRPLL